MAIRYEGQTYKVISADYHPGQGRMGGASHARLRNLSTGTLWEHSFRAELKLEEVQVEKRTLSYLYSDAGECFFMDPESYDQMSIPESIIGEQARFLTAEMLVPVEFIESRPVSVLLPEMMEARIAGTAPPVHQQQDNTWKAATLENGVEIMVPQFIKSGDTVRLEMASLKYMDRVKGAGK